MTQQHIITEKNSTVEHFVRFYKHYIIALFALVQGFILASNYLKGSPTLMGPETYYFLIQVPYLSTVPLLLLSLVPFLLGLCSMLLFIRYAKNQKIRNRFTLFFLILLALTPSFIITFATLSLYSFYAVLLLLGFVLLSEKNQTLQKLAILPLIGSVFIDLYCGIVTVVLLFLWQSSKHSKVTSTLLATLSALIVAIIIKRPLFIGPFHTQQLTADLISDLGGVSGISFFLFIIGIIGLCITWKRKDFARAYVILPLVIVGYIFNTHTIFHLGLVSVFFATVGLMKLFERKWVFVNLKRFAFFLVMLGLIFSTLSFLDRVSQIGPSQEMVQSLEWIKENTKNDVTILADASISPYIRQIAQRNAVYSYTEHNDEKQELLNQMLHATYIQDLFPLLEENNVSIIYITPQLKAQLPQDQELSFLLKNERFKLMHSREGHEVWMFSKKEN